MRPFRQPQAGIPLLRNQLYYTLRPFVPQPARIWVRRWFALRKREQVKGIWPIKPGSERPPENWQGWPEGKKFAFVLTHDVESQRGLDRVRQLAELEMQLGFRSKFNFIPEGSYKVPAELRHWLTDNGFEVGVHDLHHDGRLFSSREEFVKHAERINHYLREWDASGFRSGFMLRRLDWLHDLEIVYDGSTFDTDPFEPQPEGCQTIFPFWVPRPAALDDGAHERAGYVELPYTLPQDSSIFLLLREKSGEIWERKLEWIVQHGGMALMNIHPDYIDFTDNGRRSTEYPVSLIRRFLEHVSEKYSHSFWQPLPKQLARWYISNRKADSPAPRKSNGETRDVDLLDGRADCALAGKRAAILLYSYYPADPRPRRAAEALAACGMEVDLLCLREKEDEPRTEKINGVNVWRLPMQRRRDSKLVYLSQYGRFLASAFSFLTRRGVKRAYHLVHVHNMPDILVFAALIPKMLGAGVILDLHDPMPELMMSIYGLKADHWLVRALRTFERWSLAFADLAFTPNVAFKDLFISRSCQPEKMKIVMNSPEQSIFNPDNPDTANNADSAGSSPAEFRIMHHGSIVHRHGIDLLVKALAKVRDRIPGVRLDIYGSRTPFLDDVIEVAKACGVADIVHYHGAQPQQAIARAIQECHLGVVPNRRSAFTEINFPTRLFEYLSMHRPVIAPATRGIQDYFGKEEILLFEPDNVDDLAEKIFWASQNPAVMDDYVKRGIAVYRGHLWQEERAQFVKHAGLLAMAH